ncbi:sulfurtransferase [Desulfobacula toluolica]|uniref:sulfurtransferase n=1 Tax=Desulfobacula toluolica TaxID=28223 RepID=UPI000688C332|nr:rhodanese-like domain-containing protein [Desulfobacula toluolica]
MLKKKTLFVIASVIIAIVAVLTVLVANNRTKQPVVDTKKYLNIDISQFKNGSDIFITPHELQQKLGHENIVILDASHPKVYGKGHIPGAVSIGFKGLSNCMGKPGDKEWGTILPKDRLTKKLESLGIDNNKLVVAYSDIFKGPGGGGRAVWQMKMAGLDNVRLLYGGLELWKRCGYELSREPVIPVCAENIVLKDYDESFRANQEYIFKNLDTIKIVDVRSLKEFTGDDTSRGEARGGHIKGSQWLDWTWLMNKDASVKSPGKIIELMAGIGIKPGDEFVLY